MRRHGGTALSQQLEAALEAPEVVLLMAAPTEAAVRAATARGGELACVLEAMDKEPALQTRHELTAVNELIDLYASGNTSSRIQQACSGPAALCVLTHVARTYWAQLQHVTAAELPLLAQPGHAKDLAQHLQGLQLYLKPGNAGVTEHEHDGIGNVREYATAPGARAAVIHRLEIKSGSDGTAAAEQLGRKLVAEAVLHHAVRDHGKQGARGRQAQHTAEYRLRGLLYLESASTTSALRLPVANDVPLPWYPEHAAQYPGVVFGHANCVVSLHFEAAAGWSSALLPIEPVRLVGKALPSPQLAASS